jgi:putative (di)nucleoside polyphosphate hydrolase
MARPTRYFRAGVGAVIADARGRVLALERADIRGAWQFPQGGLEKKEKPVDAAFREIKEETGIGRKALRLVGKHPELLVYELPRKAQSKKTGLGQVQYWFYFRAKKPLPEIRLPRRSEFKSEAWVPFDRVVSKAVGFRKPVYRKLRDHFKSRLRNRGAK